MSSDQMSTAGVGNVGSPSTTAKVTVDILEVASNAPLHGDLVYLTHPLDDQALIAIGTVTEIKTSNRWHEDSNMRGVLKRYGSLPHLSGEGDVRTADVLIQAAYLAESSDPAEGEPPIESGGSLSMSPTTGARVQRVTDDFLTQLLRRHSEQIIYLGHIYRSDVRLPLIIRHFGRGTGAGEAYHTGIFGITGSGKSVLAAYLIAAQLRHPEMGVFLIDPQGQFSGEEGLPFSLQEWSEGLGRQTIVRRIASDLRLPKNAPLLTDLLGQTRFFRDILTIRGKEQQDSAITEIRTILQGHADLQNWDTDPPDDALRAVFNVLVNDPAALNRIYVSPNRRAELSGLLAALLANPAQFELAAELFRPLHSLFSPRNPAGGNRQPILGLLDQVLRPQEGMRPFVIIDFSSGGTNDLLDSTPVKARILRWVCDMLNMRAEQAYRASESLNVLVVFDEAQRFAAENAEDDESADLAVRLVDYVRTTRKYGLGWMFITQEIGSLKRGIYSQLRVRCFGYGLTSGTELLRLRETIGDPASLDLYRSFVDPAATQPSAYPFMLTGPISPLSFTGAPVFLSVYTDFDRFRADNRY